MKNLQKDLNGYISDCLTIEQVCDLLSVSSATVKNWIRLGKLHTQPDGRTFEKSYIEKLCAEIKNGKDNRLKSRRNKKSLGGKILYKDYIRNEKNCKVVNHILDVCGCISEAELKIILAHFAIQFYQQCGGLAISCNEWLGGKTPVSDHSVFNALISDLLKNISDKDINLENIEPVFKYEAQFVPSEDTLGFIYISLRDLKQRKQTGIYYTPERTVNRLINSLRNCLSFENKTVCDPCCGTGNFLIGLLECGVRADHLYGQDIDETSIFITRINLFLRNHDLPIEQLYSQFVCGNTLESTFSRTFSVVLGNPPWGYDFSKEESKYLVKNYRTAKNKGMESYDLFIEKGLSMLEKEGYMAYVLPEALLSVESHQQARQLLAENTSFRFVSYLGNVFSGVQCPAVILGLQNDGQGSTKHCKILFDRKEFTIEKDREIDPSRFSFHIDDAEYNCLNTIASVPNARFLAGNARFALGIVTGNNRKYIKRAKEDGCEMILRGSDIFRYSMKNTDHYIQFKPETFQQAAPEAMYRAKEKLLYRFICEVPVFTYDNNQTLSLNSCNILIPQIEGMSIKYVLAILNSSVAAYFFYKKYNSVKLLRSHIEAMPMPMVSTEKQNEMIEKVDLMLAADGKIDILYDELDHEIMEIFSLSKKQRDTIRSALAGKNLFFI